MTVLDLIKSALRAIGQLAPGRSPGPSETADAVVIFNRMLDALSLERLVIPANQRAVYTLTPAQASYTIGLDAADVPTVDFNVARPTRVEAAAVLVDGSEYPLEVLTEQRWIETLAKETTSSIPSALYYEPTIPFGTLHVWPVTEGAAELVLYAWAPLTQVADETVTLAFPPGYEEALTYQLAIRLAAEWGRAPRPDVLAFAAQSLGRIKAFNAPELRMRSDRALTGRGTFDIITGDYRR